MSWFLNIVYGYAGIIAVAYMLSPVVRQAMFVARFLTALVCLLAESFLGVVVALILRPINKHRITQWVVARTFQWMVWIFVGIGFKRTPESTSRLRTRPAVYVANHQSELDILMLGAVMPRWCSVTAKKSLAKFPILGQYMTLSGTVFLDRKDRSSSIAAFDSAAKEMNTFKQSVMIFPEGTRSHSLEPVLLPFKKGAFHLAVQAQVPIVPIVTPNYSNLLHIKTMVFKTGVIPVHVLEPISTEGMTSADVDELTRRVENIMREKMKEVTQQWWTEVGYVPPSPKTQANSNGAAKTAIPVPS